MPVRITLTGDTLTAYLSGEIDHHNARPVREEIDEAATRAHPQEMLLDFKDVTFMDSSGVGLVMGRYALMQELGGKLCAVNMPPQICKVMRLAGLDKLAVINAAQYESGGKKK